MRSAGRMSRINSGDTAPVQPSGPVGPLLPERMVCSEGSGFGIEPTDGDGWSLATSNQTAIFTVLTSVSVVLIYIAYAMALAAQLRRRMMMRSNPATSGSTYFSLGRWGLPINIAALAFLLLGAVNFIWPRPQIYGAGAYRFGGMLVVVAIILAGLLYRAAQRRPGAGADAAVERETARTPRLTPETAL